MHPCGPDLFLYDFLKQKALPCYIPPNPDKSEPKRVLKQNRRLKYSRSEVKFGRDGGIVSLACCRPVEFPPLFTPAIMFAQPL